MQTRTKRQKQVYDYIKQYIEKHGYEPSYQQIAWHLGVRSKAGIAKHIAALENQGLLSRRNDNGSFSLELSVVQNLSDTVCAVEWLDDGDKTALREDWQKTALILPRFFIGDFRADDLCAWVVKSDAMSRDDIFEGDIVLFEKRKFPRDGDIVAASVQKKGIYVKRFYRSGADIELRPSNDDFSVLKIPADKVEVLGIYRGILRPFG